MASRKLVVEIIGDDRSVQRAFNRSTQSANKFGAAIDKAQKRAGGAAGLFRGGGGAATFAGGAAAASAIKFLSDSADAASALQEQVSKSRVVLGEASKSVEDFGKTSAAAFGISNRAAVEAASSFAGLFTTIGVGQDKAAALGIQLTSLAGDLASFFDTSTEEALTALRSGLVGETEPLRRFNVILNEAVTSQEAMRQTGKKTSSTLTDQEKVLARISLILQKTGDAQGDVARTSDSLANKQRRLNAEFEDTKARIGELVLPLKAKLIGALSDAAIATQKLVDGLHVLSSVRIPTIEIPIIGKFGGGKAGDLARTILGDFTPKDILIPVRVVRAIRARDDDKPGTDAIKTIGGNLEKTLASARSALAKLQNAAAGDVFSAFIASVNKVIASTTAAIAKADAHAKALERLEAASDLASLAVDQVALALQRASATPTLADDITALQQIGAALAAQEKAILAQLALNKDDLGLQQDLVSVQSQQIANENSLAAAVAQRAQNQKDAARQAIKDAAELAAKQREAEKTARQAAQFKALGLSPAGDKPIPTISNLTKQLDQLDVKVTGGKNQKILNAIRKVLLVPVHKATEETRQAIRDMFGVMRGELDSGLKGPLTKTSGLNTKKIIEGLGLDADTAAQIRARLSGFNSAGQALATASNFAPVGAMAGAGAGMIQVQSTVVLDGAVVGMAVTRHQQKAARRNPRQKRGPNRIGA